MKKVFRLTKSNARYGIYEWQLDGKNLICHEELEEFFDIPDEAKTIYVTVLDKEMPQSYKVKQMGGFFNELKLSIPNKPRKKWLVPIYYSLTRLLEKEGLDNFYVRLHHECD